MMVPQDIPKPLFFTNDFMLHDLPPSSKNPRNGHVLPSNFLCSLARFFACASDGRIGTCWTRSPPSAWNLCMIEKNKRVVLLLLMFVLGILDSQNHQ